MEKNNQLLYQDKDIIVNSVIFNYDKTLYLIILLCLMTSTFASDLYAQPVTKQQAMEKAKAFFANDINDVADVKAREVGRKTIKLSLASNCSEYYIFNDDYNGGYVIIAGDERMPDVLGFSDNGHIDEEDIPCNLQALLDGYADEVNYFREHPDYIPNTVNKVASKRTYVKPFLATKWDQYAPYNWKCPKIGNEKAVTGCVATAMAQIMFYHKWPKKTTDTIPSYITETRKINRAAIPPTNFEWSKMLTSYDSSYSTDQGNAVALLMKLCGQACTMDYNLGSNGGSAGYYSKYVQTLPKYFAYGTDIRLIDSRRYSQEDWKQLIWDELKAGCPVFYSGNSSDSGHAYVLDGYMTNSNTGDYYHVSFGWGGENDGYYLLNKIPKYNKEPYALINIRPMNGRYAIPYAVFENGKLTVFFDNNMECHSGIIFRLDSFILKGFYKGRPFPSWFHNDYGSKLTECEIDPSFANYELRSLFSWFGGFTHLKKITGLQYLNTANVSDISYMFSNCQQLTTVDLNNLNFDNVSNAEWMFYNCVNLTTIYNNNSWSIASSNSMFFNCVKLVGGSGFKYDSNYVSSISANTGNNGYFTAKEDGLLGDVNSDGSVDISDVVAVVNSIAGIFVNARSDVNGDKNIDISDIVKVINIISGEAENEENKRDPAVVAGLCPDHHHPHVIDLGLGVKYSCCNVGASAPWKFGDYYAWGETTTKSFYDWKHYTLSTDGTANNCRNISDIAGTKYDVVHVKWGEEWHMPTTEQLLMLKDECQSEWTAVNTVLGMKFTGPNGQSVFLPAGCHKWDNCKGGSGPIGYYWSSTQSKTEKYRACHLCFYNDTTIFSVNGSLRRHGFSVRPVTQ